MKTPKFRSIARYLADIPDVEKRTEEIVKVLEETFKDGCKQAKKK